MIDLHLFGASRPSFAPKKTRFVRFGWYTVDYGLIRFLMFFRERFFSGAIDE